ncbi:MAG: amidohydrolase family protein [Nocardioidaceae bacterium]
MVGVRRVVDVHAHAVPLPLLTWLEQHGRADLSGTERGVVVIDPEVSGVAPGTALPLPASMHRPELRLEEMAATGVTHEAVSLPPFLFATRSLDEALVRETTARGNDALASYCSHDPGHLLALGNVPVGWPSAAEEARRCLDELGMRGVVIGSRGAGRELDDPANDDLWALVSERQAMVFLHPSAAPDPQRLSDFWLPQLLGYPMETAIAAARLVFGGVVERHPFPLVLAHGGGCLPAVRGRLTMGWGPQARRPHDAGPAGRAARAALL